MQFIRKGPDIPERLLQLHEEGRVVFFCGAGVSYPAGLPGFGKLVTKLYETLSPTPNAVQQAAIKARQFDTAIGLLEIDIMGGRETVRQAIAEILTPEFITPKTTTTHDALLTLSRNRKGRTRLITTNFDRLFEYVKESKSYSAPTYQAPLLPVPKAHWDGIVYLHGLISATPTQQELDRLVISSGDFGLAYLTERWASRFVSELFRGYTVCFVGYSINDPVLRYMMDALAADRLLGESPPEMFAFGSYPKGKEEQFANEWKSKNVTPILYREHHYHFYLHKTLQAWAETYRDGVRGKERIVAECAIGRPLVSTKQDNFVGRMLWALSDSGGLPAKRFAELNPVPSLDWLEPLSKEIYSHADLSRFGVPAQATIDKQLSFSLLKRPTPYMNAPWMTIGVSEPYGSRWDDVMSHLAKWLTRHIDDPNLLLWLVKHGGQLHYEFVSLVERHLGDIEELERDGNIEKLARIRENSPNAIPRSGMRTLWRLLLNGNIKTNSHNMDNLYRWRDYFKRDGLTASVRLALRKALTPFVSLSEAFHWPSESAQSESPERIKNIVDWEIKLVSHHVHSGMRDLQNNEQWITTLPYLLNDFNILLRDALDLMNELGGATNHSDHSYIHQPSISEHAQNKNYRDWTVLIVLTRDAWLATADQSPEQARLIAESWIHDPYPVFKRLAFFAAAQQHIIPARTALDFLLKDDNWWLWSTETQRETMRLLLALTPRLDEVQLRELEQAIIAGPPRDMFREDIDSDELNKHIDWTRKLRLSKLKQAGATLSNESDAVLLLHGISHSEEQANDNERDDFPVWMGGGWVGDRDPWRAFSPIPRSRRGILDYLFEHPELDNSKQDDWKEVCSDRFQATAYALCKLAQQNNNWPSERWRDALQTWSEEKLRGHSWHYMAPLLNAMPDEFLQNLTHDVSSWLQSIAKTFIGHEMHFLNLVSRILQMDFDPSEDADSTDDLVFRAINHPIGHVTQALLDWWHRRELEDGQQLPEALKIKFSIICENKEPQFRHGRLILAANAITLFRVDKDWTTQYLLPLFNWQPPKSDADTAWAGYLWSPRLYRPMMEVIKQDFLQTANHYPELGKHSGQYTLLLTLAALDPGDTFTTTELAAAVNELPSEGLSEVVQALTNTLESSGDQHENYWKNRIEPFWRKIWPKTNNQALDISGESLSLLCIAAGNDFLSAIKLIGNWLKNIDHPDYVIYKLHESDLCRRFPESSLFLLDAIMSNEPRWLPPELRVCLDTIAQAEPHLRQDSRFIRLDDLARRHGI